MEHERRDAHRPTHERGEADAEGLAVIMRGLLRVYMHAADGRQVTVRYVRTGDAHGLFVTHADQLNADLRAFADAPQSRAVGSTIA